MFLSILLVTVARLTADEIGLKDARVAFRVVDDIGNPVNGVHVNAGDLWSAKGYQGLTDTNGSFTCYWRKIYAPIGGVFSKKGYYTTQGNVWSWTQWGEVPTNTLTATIKRIINPVPMVKRQVRLLFPVLGEPLGFDLEKGDWVEPHGIGRMSDILITGTLEWRTSDDFALGAALATTNSHDGFVGFGVTRMDSRNLVRSALPAPQQTSDHADYTNRVDVYRIAIPKAAREDSYDKNIDYYFRFRTNVDNQGKRESAYVGWLDNGIRLTYQEDRKSGDDRRLRITFAYYYNPDPLSRSLEPREIADRQ